ncbi:hypothetical protein MRS44_002119 [Fusarium solani]|uniref:uncharacterized protein n=1 Tax=Fusarium solani TaxID=169388 RepID=UPI0032C44BCA|nr:hypothetical protein MRS44_002119 [Fusarium solani]
MSYGSNISLIGLGKGLVAHYLSLPHTTVIAGVRDPAHETAQSLSKLPRGEGSRPVVEKTDAGLNDSIHEAIRRISSSEDIQALDLVISNAGVGEITGPLAEISLKVPQTYVQVNAHAPLELFKSTLSLLRKAVQPKFLVITSVGGSFQLMNTTLPTAAYGASKALAKYFVKWLSNEHQDVVVFVATDMGNSAVEGLAKLGIDLGSLKATSVEETTDSITGLVSNATHENTHGKFLGPDGKELPW